MSPALRVRLPLVAAVALGVFLWQSDLFVQRRELTVVLPSCEPLASVDLQLYDEAGQLLRREERSFQSPPSALKEELQLQRGRYELNAFLTDSKGSSWNVRRTLDVGRERELLVELSCKP